MNNRYTIEGSAVLLTVESKGQQFECLLDQSSLSAVQEFSRWHLTKGGYVVAYRNRKAIYLHRLVTDAAEGHSVDHIDHNKLNNQLANLRLCTQSGNLQNRTGAARHSKSGVRGVWWVERLNKWRARVVVGGIPVFSECYSTLGEATDAVTAARAKHQPFSKEATV